MSEPTNDVPSTVLIVDDDAVTASSMKKTLERAGYRVPAPVQRAADVMTAVDKELPDLVLMDIHLQQDKDGVTLAKELGERYQVPVIFVSGDAERATRERAAATSPYAFVTKPFTPEQLTTSVELALFQRDKQQGSAKSLEETRSALDRLTTALADAGFVPSKNAAAAKAALDRAELSELSDREREVLGLLLDNHRVPVIAKRLSISPSTVRNHLKSVFGKVGVHSQQELIERLLRG